MRRACWAIAIAAVMTLATTARPAAGAAPVWVAVTGPADWAPTPGYTLEIGRDTTSRGYAGSGASLHVQDPAANGSDLGGDRDSANPCFTLSSISAFFCLARNGAPRGIDW